MKIISTAVAPVGLTFVGVGQAEAKGCIKGAIIGGVAGHHLANRGVVSTVAGCLGGRYIASRNSRQQYAPTRGGGARYAPQRGGYRDERFGGGYGGRSY